MPADRYLVKFEPQDNHGFQISSLPVLVERGARTPVYASQRLRQRSLLLSVRVIDEANLTALTDALLRAFDTASNRTAGLLVSDGAARDPKAKDGTGNLRLAGDFTLAGTSDKLTLIKQGGNWHELNRSTN